MEDTLTITVKMSGGMIFDIKAQPDWEVLKLKQQCVEECKIPAAQQRLVYKGKILKDEEKLSTYGVKSGHTMHLVKKITTENTAGAAAGSQSTGGTNTNTVDPIPQPASQELPMGGLADMFGGGNNNGNFNAMWQVFASIDQAALDATVEPILQTFFAGNQNAAVPQGTAFNNPATNTPGNETAQQGGTPQNNNNFARLMSTLLTLGGGNTGMDVNSFSMQQPNANMSGGTMPNTSATNPNNFLASLVQNPMMASAMMGNPMNPNMGGGNPQNPMVFNPMASGNTSVPNTASVDTNSALNAGVASTHTATVSNTQTTGENATNVPTGNTPDGNANAFTPQGLLPNVVRLLSNNPQFQESVAMAFNNLMQSSTSQQGGNVNPIGIPDVNPIGSNLDPNSFNLGAAHQNILNMARSRGVFPYVTPMDTLPPEQRFASQLQALQEMGFIDTSANILALQETGGDVSAAITRLLDRGLGN